MKGVNILIDKAEVERVAAFAKLDMGQDMDAHIKAINDLIKIIDGIENIQLDMDDEPLDMELTNTFREDNPMPSMLRQDVLANAPEVEAGCVSVPKILGGEA